jgi:UDP-N-acetyl-2-amino-2-deoxyglucuronate dehydrogenase
MLTYGKNFEGSITILGEKGTVRIGGVAVNEIEHWEFATPHDMDAVAGQLPDHLGLRLRPPAVLRQRHRHAARRCQAEVDGREGLRSLEVVIAMPTAARATACASACR